MTVVYGPPMSRGATPRGAVADWLARFGDMLGAGPLELRPTTAAVPDRRGRTMLAYRQTVYGVPVERGMARAVVLREPEGHRVVYVAARISSPPPTGFAPIAVSAASALAIVRSLPTYDGLTEWSHPRLVVYHDAADNTLRQPIRTWKINGARRRAGDYASYSFYVDTSAGRLVSVVDEVHRTEIPGRVTGLATPGTLPDSPSNRPVEIPLVGVRVRSQTGATTFTNRRGDYVVSIGPNRSGTVTVDLVGRWVTVSTGAGEPVFVEQSVFRDLPFGDVLLNPDAREFATAQLNGFIHVTRTHDFYALRQPDFGELDRSIPCRVNLGAGTDCGGFFDAADSSINLTRAGIDCVNTAYSSVVTHEYGHFIVDRLGFAAPQASFGEGFGDALAVLMHDDPVVGRDFDGPCTFVRDIVSANQPFPCEGGDHRCGQVLAGVWWDIKEAMRARLGDAAGKAAAYQRFTDWSRITLGGSGGNAAHPLTAIEVLIADDDDGDLSTLTPHFREICAGFAAHNIPCPIADCNNSGVDDAVDLANGTSADCTSNGIPDECEADCDGSGTADVCDLAAGRLSDDDDNGVPDVCQRVLQVPSADFASIQPALDAAVDGDTIQVAPGIYTGAGNRDLDFGGKILALRCVAPGECLIDCQDAGRGFFFHSGETSRTVVDGFTVVNGVARPTAAEGGGFYFFNSSPTIRNCVIRDNRSTLAGGGVWCTFASPTFENCIFVGNNARTGGAIGTSRGNPRIIHCTITGNRAISGGGVLYVTGGSRPDVRNCIFTGNSLGLRTEILDRDGGVTVSYSLVKDGWPGTDNLDEAPEFVDAPGGDFRLTPTSPGVNTGDPADSAGAGVDAVGNPRVHGCRVDRGALETSVPQRPGDFDADGNRDLRDAAFLQLCFRADLANPRWERACQCVFDANGDGLVELTDVSALVQMLNGP
ncbi:MAG: right-handed parallel beta-helix repeat-containing protein [Phycisphaerae bacterium]